MIFWIVVLDVVLQLVYLFCRLQKMNQKKIFLKKMVDVELVLDVVLRLLFCRPQMKNLKKIFLKKMMVVVLELVLEDVLRLLFLSSSDEESEEDSFF